MHVYSKGYIVQEYFCFCYSVHACSMALRYLSTKFCTWWPIQGVAKRMSPWNILAIHTRGSCNQFKAAILEIREDLYAYSHLT